MELIHVPDIGLALSFSFQLTENIKFSVWYLYTYDGSSALLFKYTKGIYLRGESLNFHCFVSSDHRIGISFVKNENTRTIAWHILSPKSPDLAANPHCTYVWKCMNTEYFTFWLVSWFIDGKRQRYEIIWNIYHRYTRQNKAMTMFWVFFTQLFFVVILFPGNKSLRRTCPEFPRQQGSTNNRTSTLLWNTYGIYWAMTWKIKTHYHKLKCQPFT